MTTLLIAMLGFLGGVLTVGAALIAVAAGAKKDIDELERRDYAAQEWKRAKRLHAGAGVCTTTFSQLRQPYLGRRTTSRAGTISRRSLVFSPIRCSICLRHRQTASMRIG